MSIYWVDLTDGPLRWWRMLLSPNEQGHVMWLRMLRDGQPVDAPEAATEAVYEFFDGRDEEITGVVATHTERAWNGTYVYFLCRHRPTGNPSWEPMETVGAILPEDANRFQDEWEILPRASRRDFG